MSQTSIQRLIQLTTKPSKSPVSPDSEPEGPLAEIVASSMFCTISALPQSIEAVAKYHRRFHFDDDHLMAPPTPRETEVANYFSAHPAPTSAPPPTSGEPNEKAQSQPAASRDFHPSMFLIIDRADYDTEGVLAVKLEQMWLTLPKRNDFVNVKRANYRTMRLPADGAAGILSGIDGGVKSWDKVKEEIDETHHGLRAA
jgi:hypothetical protein